MRWLKRPSKPHPKHQSERLVKRFLIIPKCLDGAYRWLELVKIRQRYIGFDPSNSTGGYWIGIEFVD